MNVQSTERKITMKKNAGYIIKEDVAFLETIRLIEEKVLDLKTRL